MEYLASISFIALAFMTMAIAKLVRDWRTPYDDDKELTGNDNPALGIAVAGYYLSVFIVFISATQGEFKYDVTASYLLYELGLGLAYALGGIVLMNLGTYVLDKVALPKFSVTKELVQDRNIGMGAVQCASYLSSAIIMAGAMTGSGEWYHGLAFWAVGQVALTAFVFIYEFATPFKVHEELEKDNPAVGISLGLNMIAISIILFGAKGHDFISWEHNFTNFGILTVIGLAALFAARKISDKVMLPKSSLNEEISRDRNAAAAWIEGSIAIGFAMVILFMF